MSTAEELTIAAPSAASRERKLRAARAARDLLDGFASSWIAIAIAMQDVRLRYRGSTLGPFWLTISTLVMVVAIGGIYPHLFHIEATSYIPYLLVGLVLWQFLSTVITEGCTTFVAVQRVIHQVPMPFSVHVCRAVYRNLIVLAHSAVLVPLGLLLFAVRIDWHVLLVFPAIAVLGINSFWICLLLGMLSARFRDIPPIVASFLQVLFFVTPVFWAPDALGRWKILADLNPFFAAIDIVRAPLIGVPIQPLSWFVILATTLLGCAITFAFFARFRSRIAYWL